jgi:transposase
MLTLSRPANVLSDECRLDGEFRSARWIHHRLLDFEDQHQLVLDTAAEAAAPGIVRVGRILARLARRAKRRERTTEGAWSPDPRPELAARLKDRLPSLRETRNADPGWKAALGWADEQVGEAKQARRRRAKDPRHVKRRKNDTNESFAKRFALLTADETDEHFAEKITKAKRQTRREQYRAKLYKERRIYWGTWNALCFSVDQARHDVLARRKQGMPAEWRRPKWRDPSTLAADDGGFRIIEREGLWWVIEMRLGIGVHDNAEWVRVRAKCGNWHAIPDGVAFETAKLTRRQDGARWSYTISVTVDVEKPNQEAWATSGKVSFDWGHREHGHDTASEGIRAFVWRGDDGREDEVLIPVKCRVVLDEIDALKERLDKTFNARKATYKLRDKNRHTYRRRLERSGVRTEEEVLWLRWEMRYERRIMKRRKRFQNLRRETYTLAVRELRRHYAVFVFEGERIHDSRTPRAKRGQTIRELQTEDQMLRRRRANRDLTARYEFVSLCERFGAEIVTVPSRNTTRECPTCGHLGENGPELLAACPACGTVRDKDRGAALVILRRAEEALENHAAE